jgi:hypothetical protein
MIFILFSMVFSIKKYVIFYSDMTSSKSPTTSHGKTEVPSSRPYAPTYAVYPLSVAHHHSLLPR